MKIEQLYTGCLSQAAYYIESGGQAAIIDPMREAEPYIEMAQRNNCRIVAVFETHFHADFVSGHRELSIKTGARIIYGPGASTGFDAYIGHDGEEFQVGELKIKLLHTPGHTLESCCYLLTDSFGEQRALFTGDTLFIGDVGRPDLAQPESGFTKEDLAGMLYDSLREKILPLEDHVVLYPGHGAGSSCGKNISAKITDILGNQKASNYALNKKLTKSAFIHELTDELNEPPAYFAETVSQNKKGGDELNWVVRRAHTAIETGVFAKAAQKNILILDSRDADIFALGFVPGAVNIGLNGNFAPWAGTVLGDIHQPLLLVTEPGTEKEVITRLARVGFERVVGYLEGGFESWRIAGKPIDKIRSVLPSDINLEDLDAAMIIDVRNSREFSAARVKGAKHLPLDNATQNLAAVPQNASSNIVYCAGGYRSMIFASLLKKAGVSNVINLAGGFQAIQSAGNIPVIAANDAIVKSEPTVSNKRIYFDNAATTKLDPAVLVAMLPYLSGTYGNPSSAYSEGRMARAGIENARKKVAEQLNCKSSEIIFTSGGTEANNTALRTAVADLGITNIITSPTEHHAVLNTVKDLQRRGKIQVDYVKLAVDGSPMLDSLEELLSSVSGKALVSLMHANNETGTLSDVYRIGQISSEYGALFHSDMVQTIGHYPVDLAAIPVDMVSAAGHKFHGPKGTGILYMRETIYALPMITGGAQERGKRAGTENVAGIVGFAAALEKSMVNHLADRNYISALKGRLLDFFAEIGIGLNGNAQGLYTVVNAAFNNNELTENLLADLDRAGISASGGSACSTGHGGSHVMAALGKSALNNIRFSFSKYNTMKEVTQLIEWIQHTIIIKA